MGVGEGIHYISPEALHDTSGVGPPADVYALGMTALYVIHGRPLPMLHGRQERARFVDRLRVVPPVQRVIERAVRERPTDRFADATAFADALTDALAGGDDAASSWRPALVEIPAGTFTMGQDAKRRSKSVPHPVEISRSYFMARTPITRTQFAAVMGTDPSFHRVSPEAPVESVTFNDALAYCDALSRLEGLSPVYDALRTTGRVHWGANGYRLPTEAEWERACRADAPWLTTLDPFAWYNMGAIEQTHPVAEKAPNPFGLYDMVGNVSEWCWDRFGAHDAEPAVDPRGPGVPHDTDQDARVVRGGDYADRPGFVGIEERRPAKPGERASNIGFRVVRRVPDVIEGRAVESDSRVWMVWNRTPGGWTTSLLTAPDGRIRIEVNRQPGLVVATGGRIWVWEGVQTWYWRDVPADLATYGDSDSGTQLLLERDTDFSMVDVTTGEVLRVIGAAPYGPAPEAPIGIISGNSSREYLVCHDNYLYVKTTGEGYFGGAHHLWGCTFKVYDLASGCRVDIDLPERLLTPAVLSRATNDLRSRFRDEDGELELTMAWPCYRSDGAIGTRLQLTRDDSFGSSDGLWSDYSSSARVDVFPDLPIAMPEVVRAWFAEDEAGFFGYGLADADDRLLGEILQPTNWR